MAMMECTDLRIGTSVALLHYLRNRGIEEPDDAPFLPYSIVRTAGTGEPKGYGYPSCTWVWAVMDQASMAKFLDFFANNTDAGVQVYISTYTDIGSTRTTSNYTAYMHRPVDGEGKVMHPNALTKALQNVTISFTHLEAA